MNQPIFDHVSLDSETCGLDPRVDEIVEVSAIEFNLSGVFGKRLTFRCRPESGFVPKAASDIHGIMYEDVKDCPNYLKDGIREKIIEFLGDRIAVGHNLQKFDLGFLKIKPRAIKDTLLMCREKYRGGNKLKSACERLNIEWNDNLAHGAEYDALKSAELLCKISENEEHERQVKLINDPKIPGISQEEIFAKLGVIPTKEEKRLVATQPYSYSRISLFNQCPFKWYMQYIRKHEEAPVDYLVTGNVCHKIAEWAGQWCYKETLINKIEAFFLVKKLIIPDPIKALVSKSLNVDVSNVSYKNLAEYTYNNKDRIKQMFGYDGLTQMILAVDSSVTTESYEQVTMPPLDVFEGMINRSLNMHNVSEPSIAIDVKNIMNRFFVNNQFFLTPGDILLTEKKLAFNKKWELLSNFFAEDVFFRGVLDVIDYLPSQRLIIITDYKSSRKMLTQEQIKHDTQLKVYVMMLTKFVPRSGYDRVIVRINYIRYGKVVEYEISDIDEWVRGAMDWIDNSIQSIENELVKSDGSAFRPRRNEHCHSCHIADDGECPLFNKQFVGQIGDQETFVVNSPESCIKAWKRIEANKAENSKLTKMCKAFVSICENKIPIDEKATLDFYTSEEREYFQVPLTQILLAKGVDIKDILYFASFSKSSVNELLEKKEIQLSEEELKAVSSVKIKKIFDAFTAEEAKDKGFLNA